MRLLHITPNYIPAYRYGGPIYSFHALCRNLAAAGHDVHVLTTSVDGAGDHDVPLERPIELDGVKSHYCRSRWFRRLYWSADLDARCILKSNEQLAAMGAAGANYAGEQLTWCGITRHFADMYMEMSADSRERQRRYEPATA